MAGKTGAEVLEEYLKNKNKSPPGGNTDKKDTTAVAVPQTAGTPPPEIKGVVPFKPMGEDTLKAGLYDDMVKRELQNYINDTRYKPNNTNFSDTNLALGGKFGNINRKSAADTLRYQRLVDRLNNRVYMKGQSLRPQVAGHGFSGVDATLNFDRYQMPKIETEETRQMTNMRAWEDAVRKAEIARQQGYQDLDINTKQAWLTELIRKSGGMTDSDIRRYDKMYDEQLHLNKMANDQAYKKEFDEFSKKVTENLSRETAQIALTAYMNNPITGAVLAEMLKGVSTLPSPEQKAFGETIAGRMRDNELRGMSAEENLMDIIKLSAQVNAITGITGVTAMIDSVAGALPGSMDKIKEAAASLGIDFGASQ